MAITKRQQQHAQAGFSMLELVVVIIIISVLLTVGISKLMKLQVQAERSAVKSMVGIMQSAIALTISEHIAKDQLRQIKKYVRSNPMRLLAAEPINYKGSFARQPANLEPASWWFNTRNRTLYYKVSNIDYFSSNSTEKGVIKFKILAVFVDKNGNGRFDRGETLKGLRLTSTANYQWLNEPIDPETYKNEAFLGK